MQPSQPPACPTKPPRTKFPVLISYAYLQDNQKRRDADLFFNDPRFDVLIDSGAFTALNAGWEVNLTEYMLFLKEYQSRVIGYLALDKLQDPVTTERNFKTMLDAGLRPVPVHVFGDNEARMNELFELSPWVALGGLRRPHRGPAPPSYVHLKMQWAAGRRVHWLGYTEEGMLIRERPYSCDCSSWSGGHRYGNLQLYRRNGVWERLVKRKAKREGFTPTIGRLLERAGFSFADFMNDELWARNVKKGVPPERFMLMQMNTDSYVRYILDFQLRFNVRVFLATALAGGEAPSIWKWADKRLNELGVTL